MHIQSHSCARVHVCVCQGNNWKQNGAWLPGSKETAARGARQTEDWGQRAHHSVESCDARGWCGMVMDGKVGD